jgi:hypothetical protein
LRTMQFGFLFFVWKQQILNKHVDKRLNMCTSRFARSLIIFIFFYELHSTTQTLTMFNYIYLLFANYTVQSRQQHAHTRLVNAHIQTPTPMIIFEDWVGKSSRLTKSPQASRCRQESHLPLKEQRH